MPEVPEWRLDDLAAYDAMREAAAIAASAIVATGDSAAATETLKAGIAVDPFSRDHVEAVALRVTGTDGAE